MEEPKFCSECGVRLRPASAPVEVRRTVTIVFCDLTGSTSLTAYDPEAVRAGVTRYFAALSHVLERHGGTVAKFIGDAVMAVF